MPETPLDLCGYPSIGLGNSEQKVYGHYTAERMVKSKSYTYTTFDCERHDWCTRCGIKRSWDCSITFALIYKEIERGELINLMPNWELKIVLCMQFTPREKDYCQAFEHY